MESAIEIWIGKTMCRIALSDNVPVGTCVAHLLLECGNVHLSDESIFGPSGISGRSHCEWRAPQDDRIMWYP